MSLPKHLEPQTYWERRCALLETSLVRLVNILEQYTMPPSGSEAIADHFRDWNHSIEKLTAEFPPEPKQ